MQLILHVGGRDETKLAQVSQDHGDVQRWIKQTGADFGIKAIEDSIPIFVAGNQIPSRYIDGSTTDAA